MTTLNVGDRIDPITAALFAVNAPDPAPETVTVLRSMLTHIADTLEKGEPANLATDRQLLGSLSHVLQQPSDQLWAMHCVGASEIWPMLDKEHAEEVAKATIARCREIDEKAGMEPIEVVINVVPSPYVPHDHFQYLAEDLRENYDSTRVACKRYHGHRDALLQALNELLAESGDTAAALKAKALIVQVNAEADLPAAKFAEERGACTSQITH
ncbi:hypothetical protein [Pseudomonas sp. PS01301]|uniref:hypothetical protein n=1 Tax=Pseudomonas sp. PS01301 TaxID=2991437 RepID=UPI00249B3463|nr:hypothetical protein [Pseudomonas sp. PS01301]